MKTHILLSAALLALGACTHTGAPQKSSSPSVDYTVEAKRAMQAFDSTGMVVAVSIGGETTYLDAFGKAEEGTDRLVSEDMLFPIASISKAFTTTALAILVDRGQVDWDAPMRTYIPEFSMYDPWVSRNFTVRDALTHRSGLPLGAGDLLFWPDGRPSVNDLLKALPHLKPSAGFRAEYAYDNLLYVVAGEVVARVSGQTWQEFVTAEIMDPVGLTNCAADSTRIKLGQSVVTGHERAAGKQEGTPVDERTHFGPTIAAAAGLFCPAEDMMKWANFWLDGAVTSDGERLISEKQAKELWIGVTPKSTNSIIRKSGHTNNTLYALGWNVQDFEGTRMISHSGGAPGVVSNFVLLPEKDIAIFASANDYRAAPHAITYQIADGLLDGQDFDFIDEWGARFAKSIEEAKTAISDAYSTPTDAKPPTLPLSAYVGTYRDPWYGAVEILKTNEGLFIDMSRSEILDGPLNAFDGDRFVAVWPDRSLKADAFVDFKVEAGRVKSMKIKAVSDITDFSFDFHDLNLTKID